MNRIMLASGAVIIGIALFIGGVLLGQVSAQEFQPGSMMDLYSGNTQRGIGIGMMGDDYPCQDGSMMDGQYGGMMGMMGGGMMNGRYGGMMGGLASQADVEPLAIDQAETAVTNYLEAYGDDNLILGEIMIFDNHAYAQVLDANTGNGVFEVLVDPVSGDVFPEPGPNMMWNTEYGMMSSQNSGMMGGSMMNGQFGNMMGNLGITPDTEIAVTEKDAVRLAQEYLDTTLPGTTADDHADSFPGYYTIHIEQDGDVIGMLSVNQYSGQVFLHHWHGNFIEMADESHE